MNTFTKNFVEDTFISSDEPIKNFSNFAYLKVGSGDCERKETKSYIKFNLDSISSKSVIKRVVLELYVKDISTDGQCIELELYSNGKNFSCEYMHWEDSPHLAEKILEFCVNTDDSGKYIEIDVTNIVGEWIKNRKPNNGLALISKNTFGEVVFVSSRGYNSPRLKVYYS